MPLSLPVSRNSSVWNQRYIETPGTGVFCCYILEYTTVLISRSFATQNEHRDENLKKRQIETQNASQKGSETSLTTINLVKIDEKKLSLKIDGSQIEKSDFPK